MKKFLLLVIVLFLVACGQKKNEFKEYEKYLALVDSLSFSKLTNTSLKTRVSIEEETYEAKVSIKDISYNLKAYHLVTKDYDSTYYKGTNKIVSRGETYNKQIQLNAYKNLLREYVHIDMEKISLGGIENLKIEGNKMDIYLNKAGAFQYASDVLERHNKRVEKPDVKEGEGLISISFYENLISFEASVKINDILIQEESEILDLEDFMVEEDYE